MRVVNERLGATRREATRERTATETATRVWADEKEQCALERSERDRGASMSRCANRLTSLRAPECAWVEVEVEEEVEVTAARSRRRPTRS